MAIPPRLLPQLANVTRLSNVVDSALSCPVNFPLTYQTTQPIQVQFAVATVTTPIVFAITGELKTVPQTENVTVTSSGRARSQKTWTKITQIETVNTAGAVTITAVYTSGERAYTPIPVHTNLACRTERVSTTRREFLSEVEGGFQLASLVILHTNASNLAIGDRVVVDNVEYEIENPVAELDQTGFHHTEAILKRLQVS